MSTNQKREYNILNVGVGGQGVIRASQILAWAALLDEYNVRTAETHGMAQRGGSVASYIRFGSKVTGPLIPRGNVDLVISFEASEALRNADYACPETYFFVSDNMQIPPSVLTSRTVTVDVDACVGCGNCVAFCYPAHVAKRPGDPFTFLPRVTKPVVNGHRGLVEVCTGCGACIKDKVCPNHALRLEMDYYYPKLAEIRQSLERVSPRVFVIPALRLAIEAGNPRTANVIMLAATKGAGLLPIKQETLEHSMLQFVPPKAREVNKRAFQVGMETGEQIRQELK